MELGMFVFYWVSLFFYLSLQIHSSSFTTFSYQLLIKNIYSKEGNKIFHNEIKSCKNCKLTKISQNTQLPIIEVNQKNDIPDKNKKLVQKNKPTKKIVKKVIKSDKKIKKSSKAKDIKKIAIEEKKGANLEKSGWWAE